MTSRRGFIGGLGAATLAGMAPAMAGADNAISAGGSTMQEAEFLSEPGLVHLNTGTYGLQPKIVRERVAAAVRQFESNPVLQGYKEAADTVLGLAEAARGTCASLLNCSQE